MAESLVAMRDRRDAVVAQLSDAYAADLFDIEELDRRLDLAHKAKNLADLETLVEDLGTASTALVAPASNVGALEDPSRPQAKTLRVIMSSVQRRGPWVVPKQLTMRVFWGNAELDFREASMGPGVTTLDVRVTMANLEIILPPHLAIDVDVSSMLGNVEERHRAPAVPDPARPILRVTGSVFMGNVEVSTRLPGESNWDARRRERRERKHQRKQLRAAERRALPPGRT
jgi:uncharacterized protein DUF1707